MSRIEISVKDSGNGIRKDIVDKIFPAFFTTKPAGRARAGFIFELRYCKAHSGQIKVKAKEGEGTEFIFQ